MLHISMEVDIPNEVDRKNSKAPPADKNRSESNSNGSAANQDDDEDDLYVC